MKKTALKPKSSRGYLMIELIIAISLLTVGLLGFLQLLYRSVSLNQVIADQFTANYLAMEGVEVVKNLIDAVYVRSLSTLEPWNTGFATEACYEVDMETSDINAAPVVNCSTLSNTPLNYDSSFYTYGPGTETPFYRTVHITPIGTDEIKVNSTVTWRGRGGVNYKIDLEDHFFNWRPAP